MKRVVLVDGLNLLFKVFYGIPNSIKNRSGEEIKGLVGFIGLLKRITNELHPYSIVVIFDSETSKINNLKIDSNYKQNRVDYTKVIDEENPFTQLPLIKKALDFLEIVYVEVINNEADDYIASIIKNDKQHEFIIVSTDSDFIQLIRKNVYWYVIKGKNSIMYSTKTIKKIYGILPRQYILFKSLVGDTSDNIKGVEGIGKVTARTILKYGSINKYIINNSNPKLSNKLLNKHLIYKNRRLIKIKDSVNTTNVTFNKLSKKILIYKTYNIIEMNKEK